MFNIGFYHMFIFCAGSVNSIFTLMFYIGFYHVLVCLDFFFFFFVLVPSMVEIRVSIVCSF